MNVTNMRLEISVLLSSKYSRIRIIQVHTLFFYEKFSSAMRRDLQSDFIALIVFIMISITAELKKFSLAPQGAINLARWHILQVQVTSFYFQSLSNQAITACEIEN